MNNAKFNGFDNFNPNTTFTLNAFGIMVGVSINVTPAMASVMSPNNVGQGNKMCVYHLKKQLEGTQINKKNVDILHGILLERCMLAAREAKLTLMHREHNRLKQRVEAKIKKNTQLELNF